jgi:hypothetical protein
MQVLAFRRQTGRPIERSLIMRALLGLLSEDSALASQVRERVLDYAVKDFDQTRSRGLGLGL